MDPMQAYRRVQADEYLEAQIRRDPRFLSKEADKVRAFVTGLSTERRAPDRPWSKGTNNA